MLEELQARPATAPAVVSEAWLLGALGERDAAFRILERAEAEGKAMLGFIRLPGFDDLREDTRFSAFLARMGLPASTGG